MSNTVTTFAGFLKTKYAQNLVNTIPESFILQRDAAFGRARRIGEQYQQAVITQLEQGATYSRGGQGAFALNASAAGSIEKAILDSAQFVMKSQIDYETLSKAITKGELAYGSSGDQLLKNMAMSTRKRLEIECWMGQAPDGIGVVDSTGASDIVITDATWAAGFWVGMEGSTIEIFDTTLGTLRGSATVDGVDISTKTITLSALPGGTVATDVVFFKDQQEVGAKNSFLGLLGIAQTVTGTLFNIDTAKSIWKPESFAVGGVLSFSILQDAIVTSVVKGLERGATVYVSTASWANLLTEQAALRRYGGDLDGRSTLINGGRAIEFHAATGRMEIKPSIYLQEGFAVICPSESLVRIGATDVTFKVPGMDETLLQVSDTTAGVSLFAYYNQAMFTAEPGQITLLTGVTS